jgi:hypothetical protein
MDNLIQTSLFQNKSCTLPGIGTLCVITGLAENDFINAKIRSPLYTIIFTDESNDTTLYNKFSDISESIKNTLHETGDFYLDGIGTFIKGDTENIRFVGIALPRELTQAVTAERVARQNIEHNMLVGDKETTNLVMSNYLIEEEVKTAQKKQKKKTDLWWVWAICLGIVAIAIIAIYFSQNRSTGFSFGNASPVNAASAGTNFHH